jgi:hypothetical protein
MDKRKEYRVVIVLKENDYGTIGGPNDKTIATKCVY